MKKFLVKTERVRFRIEGLVQEIGQDILLSIWGGTRPHIGAVAVAVPRPSLRDQRKWSATSSNFTFVGHKEDILAKKIAEKIAAQTQRNVVAAVGIHWDDLSTREIRIIEDLTQKLCDQVLSELAGPKKAKN